MRNTCEWVKSRSFHTPWEEGEVNSLKDVFKRLIALDIYLINHKTTRNNKGGGEREKIGLNTLLKENSYLYKKLEDSLSDLNSESTFTTSDSDSTHPESPSTSSEGDGANGTADHLTGDLWEDDCFLTVMLTDLFKDCVSKKVLKLLKKDPLVVDFKRRLKGANVQELRDYYQSYKERLGESKDALVYNVMEVVNCLNNIDVTTNVLNAVSCEAKELFNEVNWIIKELYNSRINLTHSYRVINYYRIDIEKFHVRLNTVQFGLRMDNEIRCYLESKLNENHEDLLLKLNGYKWEKMDYKTFYKLVVTTVEQVKDKRRNYYYNQYQAKVCLSDVIQSLLVKNVYGLEGPKDYFKKPNKLEPVPIIY